MPDLAGGAGHDAAEAVQLDAPRRELQQAVRRIVWTVHEIVVHLCDSEANSYVRLRKAIAEPGGAVAAFDEQRWQAALGYHDTDADEALALFRALRRQTHRLLASLPDDAWSCASEHPELGTMTVADWLRSERDHVAEHVAQIEAIAGAVSG